MENMNTDVRVVRVEIIVSILHAQQRFFRFDKHSFQTLRGSNYQKGS